jgi:hypothetical protein
MTAAARNAESSSTVIGGPALVLAAIPQPSQSRYEQRARWRAASQAIDAEFRDRLN